MMEKPFDLIEWTYEYAPAGGINSNSVDMVKYMIMQMNNGVYEGKQIISAENTKYLHTPQILSLQKDTGNSFYCLGWVYSEYSPYPFIWHTGGTSGAGTIMAFVPQEKIGIVVLTNEVGTNLHVALMLQFFDMYFKKPNQDWSQKILENTLKQEKEFGDKLPVVANPQPSLPLEMYAGTYHDLVYGDAQVIVDKDHLVVILGPNKVRGILKHLDRDIFTLILPAIDENGQNQVAFRISDKGVPDKMVFEKFAKSGYGVFIHK
jgi:CubicO group peptidase (beta-lactamase class C family)